MGQKVNPIGLRLGINRTWDSRWFAGADYAKLLHEDFKLRETLASAGAAAYDPMPLADVDAFFTSETTRYRAIVKSIGLKPQ